MIHVKVHHQHNLDEQDNRYSVFELPMQRLMMPGTLETACYKVHRNKQSCLELLDELMVEMATSDMSARSCWVIPKTLRCNFITS